MKNIKNRVQAINLVIFLSGLLFLSGCESTPEKKDVFVPPFDEERAFADLEAQVAFGPRVPGTEAHQKCMAFLRDTLKNYGGAVNLQSFKHVIDKTGESVQLTNVIASFNPEKRNRIILAAHWDSRPWADAEEDTSLHNTPVDGANDGASGVAVLLQVARTLQAHPAPIGVDIAFFDGEDFGSHGDDAT